MSLQDTVTKQYVSDPKVFADAFNYLIYDGEQIIRPEQLTDLDATQFAIPYREEEEGKPESTQKYRDVLKTLAVKTDDQRAYLVLGIENQSNVHYAMPVRNMLYDAMQYEKQVRQLAAAHRKKHDAATSDEYLSGMSREDKITPVITLVINFGSKRWDGPIRLHEMFSEQPEHILRLIPDYQVLLIDPMSMADTDLGRLNSSLREVLSYIKYQHDQEQMQRLLQEDNRFSELERNAALVIQATTKTELNIKPNAEVVDMCEAIRQMMESSKQQGVLQGMQQGMQQGRLQGRQEGIQQGRLQGRQEGIQQGRLQGRQEGIQQGSREMQLQIARDMLNANMSMQQVATLTKLTLPEVQQLQKARN